MASFSTSISHKPNAATSTHVTILLTEENMLNPLHERNTHTILKLSFLKTNPDSRLTSVGFLRMSNGSFPVAQWLEHDVNNAKVMGFIPGDCTY